MNVRSNSQRGMTLILVLVFLLVLAFGVLASLRGVMQDTVSADNMAQRTKLLTLSDVATQQLVDDVSSAVAQGQPLEVAGSSNPWFSSSNTAPDTSFWEQCQQGKASCIPLTTGENGIQAWGTVRSSGSSDAQGCTSSQYIAIPYLLTVLVVNVQSGVQTTVQSVYKACLPAGS